MVEEQFQPIIPTLGIVEIVTFYTENFTLAKPMK